MLEPIGESQRAQVRDATQGYVGRAESLFDRSFEPIPVLFDLAGSTAGMFKVVGSERCIRYNPWIFAKYFEENLRDTVPHEVAHYVVHQVYRRGRVRPHGPEWQAVMGAFGADPTVTFNLDISDIPQRRERRHRYLCACREHQISSTRHNRVLRKKATYQCRRCQGDLVFAGQGV